MKGDGPPKKVIREFERMLEFRAKHTERALIAAFRAGAGLIVVSGDLLFGPDAPRLHVLGNVDATNDDWIHRKRKKRKQ
jgi:hypothetical protein